jgi:hypothetical protein
MMHTGATRARVETPLMANFAAKTALPISPSPRRPALTSSLTIVRFPNESSISCRMATCPRSDGSPYAWRPDDSYASQGVPPYPFRANSNCEEEGAASRSPAAWILYIAGYGYGVPPNGRER